MLPESGMFATVLFSWRTQKSKLDSSITRLLNTFNHRFQLGFSAPWRLLPNSRYLLKQNGMKCRAQFSLLSSLQGLVSSSPGCRGNYLNSIFFSPTRLPEAVLSPLFRTSFFLPGSPSLGPMLPISWQLGACASRREFSKGMFRERSVVELVAKFFFLSLIIGITLHK